MSTIQQTFLKPGTHEAISLPTGARILEITPATTPYYGSLWYLGDQSAARHDIYVHVIAAQADASQVGDEDKYLGSYVDAGNGVRYFVFRDSTAIA